MMLSLKVFYGLNLALTLRRTQGPIMGNAAMETR
jgi:hypothetical protein